MNSPTVTIADCEGTQAQWFAFRAAHLGGRTWQDDGLWIDGPDGLNLMFPEQVSSDSLTRGIEHAREHQRSPIGVWGSSGLDEEPLLAAGFTPGWEPCWMSRSLDDWHFPTDPRVRLETDTDDYQGDYASYRGTVRLAGIEPRRVFYVSAHSPDDDRIVGRAIAFLDDSGRIAGIFDVAVWPEDEQRKGYGTALMHAACRAARQAGARAVVLNATPMGELLYPSLGFMTLGRGRTWWWHA